MSRVVTSVLLVPAVTWVIFFADYRIFWAVVALFAFLCYREYSRIVGAHGLMAMPAAGYAAGAVVLAEVGRYSMWVPAVVAIAGLVLALRASDLKLALPSAGALLLGVYYVFGAWAAALVLRQSSPHWLFFSIAINWVGDVSAYYVGRAIGRRKLAPRVSPGKSWEGAIASAILAAGFGVAYLGWAMPSVPIWQRVVLSLAGNAAGQLGDLAESAMKRGAGMKDSGTGLPGHGGWLDRLDSSLFSMPTVAILRTLMIP